jgi:Transposase DDE domain group 1
MTTHKRPVGRPPQEMRRYYSSFSYQAGSWNKPRRVVAKVEWHPGELYPRVGFIVTNLARPAEYVVTFYNHRGTCEQYIKEGKSAIKWTRLSCRSFAANAVRLQLHALAYNLGNFMRTLAMPKTAEPWSLTSLREKLIKIGAKVVSHGRYTTFQIAEVAAPRQMFQEILMLIAQLRALPAPHEGMGLECDRQRRQKCALTKAKPPVPARCGRATRYFGCHRVGCDRISLRRASMRPKIMPNSSEIRGMSVYTEHYHFTSCLQPDGTWKIA